MRVLAILERAAPYAGRLMQALTELTLATAVIISAIVAGHNLREWRDWYPAQHHPWLQGPLPAAEVSDESR